MRGSSGTRPPKRRWWIAGAVVLVIALAVGVFVATRPTAPTQAPTVMRAKVTRTTEQSLVSLSGALAPQQQANLSFGSAGKVATIPVSVGQSVAKGQAVATLDDTSLRNSVAVARANVDVARAQLTSTREAAGSTSAQVSASEAQLSSARARLASAEDALANAVLTSPIDGVVAAVGVDVGDQVSAGVPSGSSVAGAGGAAASGSSGASSAAVVVMSPDSWLVEATVGPGEVGLLAAGQAASVTVTGTATTVGGTVATVGLVAETSSGSTVFPVTITLNGTGTGMFDGVAVTASVTAGTHPDVLSVPTAALRTQGAGVTVEKVVDGLATTTPVTTGQVFGNRTQVLTGLAEGDEVEVVSRRVTVDGAQAGGFAPPGGGFRTGTGGGRPSGTDQGPNG